MPHQSTPSRQQFVRLCDCGCGQPTLLAAQTIAAHGHVKGQPLRFIVGHSRRSPGARPGARHSAGYIGRYLPQHPAADANGYVLEHRLVMEQTLGRYLRSDEVVHHRNRVRDDNRPENLAVMTQSEHARIHGGQRWSRRYDACVDCGTTNYPHNAKGRCHSCYMLRWRGR